MAKTKLEIFRELGADYGDLIIGIAAKLQKVQDKVCSVCVSRKICTEKAESRKLADEIVQTKDIMKISRLVGELATHITREIAANVLAATLEKDSAEDKGIDIPVT